MIRILCFAFCNLFLILSTIGIVKLSKINDLKDKIISGVILYFFRVLVYSLLLGYIIKSLDYLSITILSFIEFLIVNILYKLKKQNLLLYLKEILIGILRKKYDLKPNFNLLVFCVFLFTFIIMGFFTLTFYEYSFDGNFYHLPHIIDYVQNGEIYFTNNTIWNNVYPLNVELLNMFYMLFSKSIILVRMPQLIFSILGMVVVYSLIVEFNFKKVTAFKSSILYFASPFILAQITTTYLDGIVVTLFLTLIYYLIKIIKYNRIIDEVMYFLTISIFMGAKGTCTIYAILISLVYIIFKLYKVYKSEEKINKLIVKWIIFLFIVIVIGCNWMLKNLITYGNPIHPFKFMNIEGLDAKIDIGEENEPLSFKGKNNIQKIFSSWMGLSSSHLTYNDTSILNNLVQTHDSRIGGLGLTWMYFLIPCVLISIYAIIAKKYKLSIYEIITISILLVCFLVTPANWWGRYVGYIVLIGYIGYGIFEKIFNNKIYLYIINCYYLLLLVLSIYFSTTFAISMYKTPYTYYNQDFANYLNERPGRDIVVLEESYDSVKYFTFLKGDHIQNRVDTYYIEEIIPNAMVKNHKIESYENFIKIVDSYEALDCIIILNSTANKKNKEFMERYYNENKSIIKKQYGDDILVYEKSN